MTDKKRPTHDDVGFDEQGEPYLLGEAAGREGDAIVDDPRATPVLVVALLDGSLGIRVFGPPSPTIADLLDQIAATYRKSVEISLGRRQ